MNTNMTGFRWVFSKSLGSCALDEISISIERVNMAEKVLLFKTQIHNNFQVSLTHTSQHSNSNLNFNFNFQVSLTHSSLHSWLIMYYLPMVEK